jgi:hypothetical protein
MLRLDPTMKSINTSARLFFRRVRSRFAHERGLRQGQMIYRPTSSIGRRMDSVRTRDRVGQTAFVSHVIVFMGRLMVTIAEYGERALRLGRRQLRFPRLFRRRSGRRNTSLRYGIQMGFLLQRTGTALSMNAATFWTRVLCNIHIRNKEPGCRYYHAHASDPASQEHGDLDQFCGCSSSCHHTRTLCGLSVTCVGRDSEDIGRLDGLFC